ncbi:MAG: RluA family pseudouridine synthase [Desulfobacterota bacterium]|nr:RluA family pseudouridine synthase [Thermodesulfobacteriota bacterium]
MKQICITVREQDKDKRLDRVLAEQAPDISRSQVQYAIRQGRVTVNGVAAKPSHRVSAGDVLVLEMPDPIPMAAQPENIPLDIVYEDDALIVINKPAGLVVHPACGNYTGTLVNALLHHCTTLSGIGGVLRPGIVHRLDKGTTGILVVAKTDRAHHCLSEQFKQHTIVRKYRALVYGVPPASEGTIASPIGRHKTHRKKMAIRTAKGKHAVTHWRLLESFKYVSYIEARLETGRTHQVRVHCASIGNPIVGDDTYGTTVGARNIPDKKLKAYLQTIKRPLLHAGFLQFLHPMSGATMTFNVPLPEDFLSVLQTLQGESHD